MLNKELIVGAAAAITLGVCIAALETNANSAIRSSMSVGDTPTPGDTPTTPALTPTPVDTTPVSTPTPTPTTPTPTPTPAPRVPSKLTVQGLCRGQLFAIWLVTNAKGERGRNFTYQVWIRPGKWGVASSAYVSAHTTVPVITHGGSTIRVRYYNGYAVALHTYAKAARAVC